MCANAITWTKAVGGADAVAVAEDARQIGWDKAVENGWEKRQGKLNSVVYIFSIYSTFYSTAYRFLIPSACNINLMSTQIIIYC